MSDKLGLEENQSKSQYSHETTHGLKRLREAVDNPGHVTPVPKVLGHVCQGITKRHTHKEETKRWQKAIATATRCGALPCGNLGKIENAKAAAIRIAA